MLEKDKRRLKRRSSEAKALTKKQFRQQVINNKKKKGNDVDEIQVSVRTIHELMERDDLPE